MTSDREADAESETQVTAAIESAAHADPEAAGADRKAGPELADESLRCQRDDLMLERDALIGMRNALMRERDALIGERDGLMRERDALMTAASRAPMSDDVVTWVPLPGSRVPRAIGVNVDGAHGGQVVELIKALRGHRVDAETDFPADGAIAVDQCPELLLIGGRTRRDGRFDHAGGRVRHRLPSATACGYHPIVLADVLDANLSGNVVACGYPGTGNGIVQAGLEAIIAGRPSRRDAGTATLSAFAADYRRLADEVLGGLDLALDAERHEIATYQDGLASAGWSSSDERSVLFGLPLRNHLCEIVHKTHGPYSAYMARLVRQGARCVLVVRNPLDTVVSLARKAGAVLDLFQSEWHLRLLATGLTAYYESFREAVASGAVQTVRYEDCAADFSGVLQRVARLCDVDLEQDGADRVALALWDRPVSGPGHLWMPGVGKWKDYLGRSQLSLLLDAGIGEAMAQLNYPVPIAADHPELPPRSISQQRAAPQTNSLAFFTHCCRSVEDAVAAFDNAGAEINLARWNGLHFVSTDAAALDRFAEFAERGPLRNFLALGRLESSDVSAAMAPPIGGVGAPATPRDHPT